MKRGKSSSKVTISLRLTLSHPLFSWYKEQDWDRASFQVEVSGLIQLMTEGRLRRVSGPAHNYRVRYIHLLAKKSAFPCNENLKLINYLNNLNFSVNPTVQSLEFE